MSLVQISGHMHQMSRGKTTMDYPCDMEFPISSARLAQSTAKNVYARYQVEIVCDVGLEQISEQQTEDGK